MTAKPEQQQKAPEAFTEWWGTQLDDSPTYQATFEAGYNAALAAGQQALEQTQVEAEPEWNDENVIAYCIARGISAAKAFTTGATQPQATEPAPSTAGELASKTAMLAKTTAWLDGMGGAIHTYSSRGIALAGFERGWEAALLQSTADHIAEQRKLVAAMPVVQLTHPTADMQIAGGAVELDYTGVQTAPNTVGWLTAARVWLAMERASTQPKRLTFEALNAAREAHQNKRTDDYFEAQPQIDNTDRRRVFENGYKRGFDDGMVFQRDQGAA